MLRKTLQRSTLRATRTILSRVNPPPTVIHNVLPTQQQHHFSTTKIKQFDGYASTSRNMSLNRQGGHFHLGIVVVPQGEKWIVERLGKYVKTLDSGIHLLIPFIDRIAYKHSTKEIMFDITKQTAITKDNVQIHLDGVVFFKVDDPKLASYEITDYFAAITNLAQTTMRGEIGKITLDTTFADRQRLNHEIVSAIEKVALGWGINIKRYEIRDITVPQNIKNAMDFEAEAERKKRRTILDSQAERDSQENVAKGRKIATTLVSEATMIEEMNHAKGEAFAITAKAEAQALAIKKIADALNSVGGDRALMYRVAENYIENFGKIAQKGNTIIIPANVNDTVGMVTQATTIFEKLRNVSEHAREVQQDMTKDQAVKRLAEELQVDPDQLQREVKSSEQQFTPGEQQQFTPTTPSSERV